MAKSEKKSKKEETKEEEKEEKEEEREESAAAQEDKNGDAATSSAAPQHEQEAGKSLEVEPDAGVEDTNPTAAAAKKKKKKLKLYKSSRLKGYLTIVLASLINYNAASRSDNTLSSSGAVPSTNGQRTYALTVAFMSLILTGAVTLMHLDGLTCLEKVWVSAFRPKSRIELALALFLVLWWSVATGVNTSVNGIAGDGKQQYSLYFSSWACCFASFWILERWWVAAGLSSLKAFITSWPYRSPGWLCIFFMSTFTMIWFLDMWQAHPNLGRDEELTLLLHFTQVPDIQWDLMISLIVFTITPSAIFVLAEIFRETKPDGSNEEKSRGENIIEGVCLLLLIVTWIPTIIWITSPNGAASLAGNAYFSSWILVIFIAETGVWFVHDLRERIHQSLEQKQLEYREKQRQVIEKARAIQTQKAMEQLRNDNNDMSEEPEDDADSTTEDYMDALTDL